MPAHKTTARMLQVKCVFFIVFPHEFIKLNDFNKVQVEVLESDLFKIGNLERKLNHALLSNRT